METRPLFKITTVFTAWVLTLAASVAFADTRTDARNWARDLALAVQSERAKFEPVDLGQNSLSIDALEQLKLIAGDQAQVWADTILESDFVAENEVKLDSVETIKSGATFLGYRVTYSATAVDTSNCQASRDLASCQHGRIVESSFVGPELSSWIRDDQNYAKFVSNNPSNREE